MPAPDLTAVLVLIKKGTGCVLVEQGIEKGPKEGPIIGLRRRNSGPRRESMLPLSPEKLAFASEMAQGVTQLSSGLAALSPPSAQRFQLLRSGGSGPSPSRIERSDDESDVVRAPWQSSISQPHR